MSNEMIKIGDDGQPVAVGVSYLDRQTTEGSIPTGHAFLEDIAHDANPGYVDHDRNPGTRCFCAKCITA